MNENRHKVLEMLSAGRINADEAERLISALEKEPKAAKPKYLRVLVKSTDLNNGPGEVNVRVPLQLLRAGVRLASIIPPQAWDHVNHAMQKDGVPFDLKQLKPENLEALVDELADLTVDVDDKTSKVMVFCE